MGDCFRSENLRLVLYFQMVITLESNYKENTHQNRLLYGPKTRAHIFLTLVRTELQLKVYQMKDACVNLPTLVILHLVHSISAENLKTNQLPWLSLLNQLRSINHTVVVKK